MKTRIVYPQLWLDEKFANCKQSSKLLFLYLITNDYLGLSRYSRISDRRTMFDTGLNSVQLKEAKDELEQLKWVFFKDGEWIYHNHKCAYMDYVRNEKVETAKQVEVESVPEEIVRYFNDICLNNVQTTPKHRLDINHKSEIINQKEGGVGETKCTSLKDLTPTVLQDLATEKRISLKDVQNTYIQMKDWLESKGKTYKDYKAGLRNWINKKLEEGRIKHITPEVKHEPIPTLTPEELAKNRERLEQLRKAHNL